MKKIMLAVAFILAATTVTFAQIKSDTSNMNKKMMQKKYTCSMHNSVVKSRPGKCPKCGMKLVSKKTKSPKVDKSMTEMKM